MRSPQGPCADFSCRALCAGLQGKGIVLNAVSRSGNVQTLGLQDYVLQAGDVLYLTGEGRASFWPTKDKNAHRNKPTHIRVQVRCERWSNMRWRTGS